MAAVWPASAGERSATVLSQPVILNAGDKLDIAVPFDRSVRSATFIMTPAEGLRLFLYEPDGRGVEIKPAVGARGFSYRMTPGSPGRWKLRVWKTGAGAISLHQVRVDAASAIGLIPVALRGPVIAASGTEIAARLTGTRGAAFGLEAKIISPSGMVQTVALHDDGAHGDARPGDGNYAGRIASFREVGRYTVEIVAKGPRGAAGGLVRRECRSELDVAGPLPEGITIAADTLDLGILAAGGRTTLSVEMWGGGSDVTVTPRLGELRNEAGEILRLSGAGLPDEITVAAAGRKRLTGSYIVGAGAVGEFKGDLSLLDGVGKELGKIAIRAHVFTPKVKVSAAGAGAVKLVAGGRRIVYFDCSVDAGSTEARVFSCTATDMAGNAVPGLSVVAVRRTIALEPGGTPLGLRVKAGTAVEPGSYRVSLVLATAVGEMAASVPVEILSEGLILPGIIDFGRGRIDDAAETSFDISARTARRSAVWVRPGNMFGPEGAVLSARFMEATPKNIELGLGRTGKVRLAVSVPADLPLGVYDGNIEFAGGGLSGLVPARLELVATSFTATPSLIDLGGAKAGELLEATFDLTVAGVGPSEVRFSTAGRVAKPLRPQVELAGDIIELKPSQRVIEPGGKVTVSVSAVIPDGAEDGEYAFDVTVTSRRARQIIPAVLRVVPDVPAPAIVATPKELKLRGGPGHGPSSGRIIVTSHSDLHEPVTVSVLKGDLVAAASVRIIHEGVDLLAESGGVFRLEPRGTANLDLIFGIDRTADPGLAEMALILSASSHTESVQLPVTVLAPPPRARPGPFSGMLVSAQAAVAILAAVALAALAWSLKRGMGRYVCMSIAGHLAVIIVSVPLMGEEATSGAGAPGRAVAIKVMADVETYGVAIFSDAPRMLHPSGRPGSLPEPLPVSRAKDRGDEPVRAIGQRRHDLKAERAELETALAVLGVASLAGDPTVDASAAAARVALPPAVVEADLAPVKSELFADTRTDSAPAETSRDEAYQAIIGRTATIETLERVVAAAPMAPVARLDREVTSSQAPAEQAVSEVGDEGYSADALPTADFDRDGPPEGETQPVARSLSAVPHERTARVADLDRATSFGFNELGPEARFTPTERAEVPAPPRLARAGDPRETTVPFESPDRPLAGGAKTTDKGRGPSVRNTGQVASADTPSGSDGRTEPPAAPVRRTVEAGAAPSRVKNESKQVGPRPIRAEIASAEAGDLLAGAEAVADERVVKAHDGGDSPQQLVREIPGAVAGEADPARGLQAVTMARGERSAGSPMTRLTREALVDLVPSEGEGMARAYSEGVDKLSADSGPSRGPMARGRRLIESSTASVLIGRARHSGLWNAAPGALFTLVEEFDRRYPNFQMKLTNRSVTLDKERLSTFNILYLTGRGEFKLTGSEAAALGEFLKGGGSIWIDDCSTMGDAAFDRSFRSAIFQAVPGGKLEHLAKTHPVYRAGYDLRGAFGKYRMAPGGVFRAGFFEGLDIDGRTVVLYSRNAYGRGLVADPYQVGVGRLIEDVSPRRLREASTRVSLNVLAFFLGGGASGADARPGVGAVPVSVGDPEAPWRHVMGAVRVWEDFDDSHVPFKVSGGRGRLVKDGGAAADRRFEIAVDGLKSRRSVASRAVNLRVRSVRSIVMDVENRLGGPIEVSLELIAQNGQRYESAPVFLPRGRVRNLRVPLDREDFKSTASGWAAYDSPLAGNSPLRVMGLVVYPGSRKGTVAFDSIRFELKR